MIEFYYQEEKLCSMPTEGVKPEQILAARAIVAEKKNVKAIEIGIEFPTITLEDGSHEQNNQTVQV